MTQAHETDQKAQPESGTPLLEQVAAAIGLLLTLALLGFIGWQAWSGNDAGAPVVEVRAGSITRAGPGYVLEFTAENLSQTTAAAVQVQGELREGEQTIAISQVTLDFVPGGSTRRGGLFFEQEPNAYHLELRALGYAQP